MGFGPALQRAIGGRLGSRVVEGRSWGYVEEVHEFWKGVLVFLGLWKGIRITPWRVLDFRKDTGGFRLGEGRLDRFRLLEGHLDWLFEIEKGIWMVLEKG